MISKSKILTAMIALVASTSLYKATCPSQRDISDKNIADLSKTGEATISDKVYKMIGEDKTDNHFNTKLLEYQTTS
jgi:hypothetical protein